MAAPDSAQLFDHAERYRRLHIGFGPTAWATAGHREILEPGHVAADLRDAVRDVGGDVGGEIPVPKQRRRTARKEPR